MANTFSVNNRRYFARAFDFNTVCDLEDMGIALETMAKKPMAMMRAYLALSSGMSTEQAGLEIQAHIVDGGTLDEMSSAMSVEMEQSDFFRSLNKGEEAEDTEVQDEQPKKKTTRKSTAR